MLIAKGLVQLGGFNLELGLVVVGSTLVASMMVMLCACLKRKRGASVSSSGGKNGHLFGSSIRHSSILDGDLEDDGLRGARATSHRRLPDLPDPLVNGLGPQELRQSSVRSSQDNSSELYAQVEIGTVANSFPHNGHDDEALKNGTVANICGMQTEEVSEVHPYDKVKSTHGYSKIKKKAENPYAKVKRSDTMESETAEADENETDTDNYDVVYNPHTIDEASKRPVTETASSGSVGNGGEHATVLMPPPLPLPLRGSHSSLASGGGEPGSHGPRPPPRGRRSITLISQAGSIGNLHRPGSLVISNHDASDATDGGASAIDEHQELDSRDASGPGAAQQIHFSGDSQTSQDSKGYSSISVREPLANLKGHNPPGSVLVGRQRIGSASHHHHQPSSHQQSQRLSQPDISDPHYATVSDAEDSDEMYAAIAELQPIYDSNPGSDTYAKINDRGSRGSSSNPPTAAGAVISVAVSVAVNPTGAISPVAVVGASSPPLPTTAAPLPEAAPERVGSSPVPPTPPSVVSLKHLSTGSSGSSRLHASTLSIASTTSNVGSPKPEKRQANSPLPPPPVHQQQQQLSGAESGDERSSRKSMNIEEMYAKVTKKKGFTVGMPAWFTSSGDASANKQLHRGSVDLGFLTSREEESSSLSNDSSRRNSVDVTVQRPAAMSDLLSSASVIASGGQEVESRVALVDEEDEDDFRYEVLPPAKAKRPDRKVSESDPGYEKIQLKNEDSFNDPRYERIGQRNDLQTNRTASEEVAEPNYEIVGFQSFKTGESNEPGYEEVEMRTQEFERLDPNYESLHYTVDQSPPSEPAYATVDRAEPDEQDREPTTDQVDAPVNNNTVHVPVYAQVVKPKRNDIQMHVSTVIHPVSDGAAAADNPNAEPASGGSRSTDGQDYSVSSSKNTTIIRITSDYRYFDDDTFGVPEQV